MDIVFGLLVMAMMFCVETLPGLLVSYIGWRLSSRIKNTSLQMVIRAGMASIAIAPAFYGHAGIVPAIWVIFFPGVQEYRWAAMIALLLVWFIALLILRRRRIWGQSAS